MVIATGSASVTRTYGIVAPGDGDAERRLRVMPAEANVTGTIFSARGRPDRRDQHLYLCGQCSILFGDENTAAIRAGVAGRCANCGTVNQL